MSNPYLSVKHVEKGYQIGKTRIEVLRDVSMDVQRGEFVALLGASGCGKTTLLNLLGTLERTERGEIICDSYNYNKMSSRECSKFRSKHMGFIFQSYQLIPELNVLSNVLLANRISPIPNRQATQNAQEILNMLGLSHRLKHYPLELSGGEQQRVAIARALLNKPKLIFADEPTGNLDRNSGEAILDIFSDLRKDMECRPTIIMVTHDEHIAQRADRIIRLVDGCIVSE